MARGPAPNALAFIAALILWSGLLYLSRPPLFWSSPPQSCQSAGLGAPCAELAASRPPPAPALPF